MYEIYSRIGAYVLLGMKVGSVWVWYGGGVPYSHSM